MATKKIGSAGRFGSRYGKKIRTKIADVERRQRTKHRCPACRRLTLQRIASGIYRCKKCLKKFAGRAYTPE